MAPNGVSYRPRLILASASPRRHQLLAALGVAAEQRPVDLDETAEPGETPDALVLRLATAKAEAGLADAGGEDRTVVIGADTVVALDGEIFGKPACPAEARCMLSRLSGRRHQIFTGVAVATAGRTECAVEVANVSFRELDAADIDCYVATGEPLDKAGAYAIQGRASLFVNRMEGTYQSAVGLPVVALDVACSRVGWPLATWFGTA
ncbi:MAG: Maf family protein [Actinomycetota bacterium]